MTQTRRSRSDWHALVLAWRNSRLPASQFARRRHLDPRQLRWWAWKLGQPSPDATTNLDDVHFVEVPVTHHAPPPERLAEIIFADHRTLRFPTDIEPRHLAQILALLDTTRS